MCYIAFNSWLGWLQILGKKWRKKICVMFLWMVDLVDFTSWENLEHRKFYMCVAQWLTWLTSLFGKKIEEKKICVTFLSMVDLVDFTSWENLEHKKFYMCVAFSGWLGWLYFLAKKLKKKKNMCYVPFNGWLGWLHFLTKKFKKYNMCYVAFNGWLGWLHFLRNYRS